ncbi:MAG: Unknown protein [uncultured Thiotrichaceae bacterium]|uniref:Uncharacterized protein n=1 Tax=uncultured Thiotrichaceae bacterium TaxID=298394 RepID=A0A6S6TJB9_9GAMM|nr:MAG: Unknown protein [uncultured Thiotrichaceae bacterium]
MEVASLNNAGTGAAVTDLQGLLGQQQTQMESTMTYQSESAKLNLEFQMHKAATDRLNSMAEAIGNTAQQTSQQLAS